MGNSGGAGSGGGGSLDDTEVEVMGRTKEHRGRSVLLFRPF